jgi:hypothetical protein
MRAFTPFAASFFTSRSASAFVLYAASWMVQIPRGALFAGALALSAGRARSAGALAGLADSFRDVATVDSGSSMVVAGVDALGAPVVPDAFDPLVVAAAALPVVRGAWVAVAGGTGAPRDAPAGVTFAVDRGVAAGGVAGDAFAVAVEQCDP